MVGSLTNFILTLLFLLLFLLNALYRTKWRNKIIIKNECQEYSIWNTYFERLLRIIRELMVTGVSNRLIECLNFTNYRKLNYLTIIANFLLEKSRQILKKIMVFSCPCILSCDIILMAGTEYNEYCTNTVQMLAIFSNCFRSKSYEC